jgi:hypothetical protein
MVSIGVSISSGSTRWAHPRSDGRVSEFGREQEATLDHRLEFPIRDLSRSVGRSKGPRVRVTLVGKKQGLVSQGGRVIGAANSVQKARAVLLVEMG